MLKHADQGLKMCSIRSSKIILFTSFTFTKAVLQHPVCFLELLHLHEKGKDMGSTRGLLTDAVNEAVIFRIVLFPDVACSMVQ